MLSSSPQGNPAPRRRAHRAGAGPGAASRDVVPSARPRRLARRGAGNSRGRSPVPAGARRMSAQTSIQVRPATDDERPAVLAAAAGVARLEPRRGARRVLRLEAPPESLRPVAGMGRGRRRPDRRVPHVLALGIRESRRRASSAVRAVDTATHPDYQGRGIFRLLTLAGVEAMTAEGVQFVFNTPNDQSRPGYLKMGWLRVGRPSTSVRVRSLAGTLRMLSSRVPADRWPLSDGAGSPAAELVSDPHVDELLGARSPSHAASARIAPGSISSGVTGSRRSGIGRSRPVAIRPRASRCSGCDGEGERAEAALCEVVVPRRRGAHGPPSGARRRPGDRRRLRRAPRPGDAGRRLSPAPAPRSDPDVARPRDDGHRAAAPRRLGALAGRRRAALSAVILATRYARRGEGRRTAYEDDPWT